ncbi:MAG: methyltransferase domain-containing protein [Desulfobacterales bacterium]|nr:methyltransferase domain-containing protein [Desulfobacterales bacterium]
MPLKGTLTQSKSGELKPDDLQQIRKAIRKKYAEVAISADGKFQYLTGKEGADALGYDPSILEDIPPELLNSFCGVGNPFSIAEIKQDSVVLDVGSGSGFDLVVASRLTGPGGQIYGIDLTKEMVDLANDNLGKIGVSNVEIIHVESEEIPFGDNMFDVVISNGVINLSPCKQDLFKEINRVLKPGGQFQFADIVAEKELPPTLTTSLEAWSQ